MASDGQHEMGDGGGQRGCIRICCLFLRGRSSSMVPGTENLNRQLIPSSVSLQNSAPGESTTARSRGGSGHGDQSPSHRSTTLPAPPTGKRLVVRVIAVKNLEFVEDASVEVRVNELDQRTADMVLDSSTRDHKPAKGVPHRFDFWLDAGKQAQVNFEVYRKQPTTMHVGSANSPVSVRGKIAWAWHASIISDGHVKGELELEAQLVPVEIDPSPPQHPVWTPRMQVLSAGSRLVVHVKSLKNLESVEDAFVDVRVNEMVQRTADMVHDSSTSDHRPAKGVSRRFDFGLDEGEKTQVKFEVYRAQHTSMPVGSAKLPVSLLMRGQIVSDTISINSDHNVKGEIDLEAQLVPAEFPALPQDSNVIAWSNSQKDWIDCKLSTSRFNGSLLVLFAGSRQEKWIHPPHDDIRIPFEWISIRRGSEIPTRAVRAGHTETDGEAFVGRNEFGEVGKINTRSTGSRAMHNLWVADKKDQTFAEVLTLRPGFVASWEAITKGQPLKDIVKATDQRQSRPEQFLVRSALHDTTGRNQCYVARTSDNNNEPGMLTVNDEGGAAKMEWIRCHHAGEASSGEALVIHKIGDTVREFELEIVSGQDFGDPEYVFGDKIKQIMGGVTCEAYVEVSLRGSIIRQTGFRPVASGNVVEFNERMHIAVDSSMDTPELKFRVLAKRNMRGDSMFGEGRLTLSDDVLSSRDFQPISLTRPHWGTEKNHGMIKVSLRELHREAGDQAPVIAPAAGLPVMNIEVVSGDEELGKIIRAKCGDNKDYASTIHTCIHALASGLGGALLGIMDMDPARRTEYPFCSLDGEETLAKSCNLARALVGNVNEEPGAFTEFLDVASTAHRAWTHAELKRFRTNQSNEDVVKAAQELTGRPKGGVMFVSLSGDIFATDAWFELDRCCPYLFDVDDKRLSIRHSTAIAVAHWMGCREITGAILSRDEDGDVYILFPCPQGHHPPEAYRRPKPTA